jgi:hypothetical protein
MQEFFNNTLVACSILPPQTIACSNQGSCIQLTGKCQCDIGYSSLGDWSAAHEEGIDCDMDINVLKDLGILNIILGIEIII